MAKSLMLGKYSLGVGDRFGRQARPQLRACILAADRGVEVIPVWNKSNREHVAIGSDPASTRQAANAAVKALNWSKSYHVDADHIRIETVDRFVEPSDYFTIDVAEWLEQPASAEQIKSFAHRHPELAGRMEIPGVAHPMALGRAEVERIAAKYLPATGEAGRIYRHLERAKGEGRFITEISIDETDHAQSPAELVVILTALADERVPLQTIAPKFTGRFNKGVDYAGDIAQFEQEFNEDLAVIRFAVGRYDLPANLKLSVHSGSDKFSIYAAIHRALKRFDAGVHLKTAGTTWLEELIGLAESRGDGLALAKEVYAKAVEHLEELRGPYAAVIDIDRRKLPSVETVNGWTGEQFAAALRHEPWNKAFNPHLRQLLHVAYKIAAQMGARYLEALDACQEAVSRNVTFNLYGRHIKPVLIQ